MKTKYTHQDVLNKICTHREFYSQFVTPHIKQMVLMGIGEKAILASTDPYFNDIPLHQWDHLAGASPRRGNYRPTLRIEDGSLSSAVCTLKEAARQIKEEAAQ